MMNSWSIGSALEITNRTVDPGFTVTRSGSNRLWNARMFTVAGPPDPPGATSQARPPASAAPATAAATITRR